METIVQDIRYGMRFLWRTPGFAIVVIFTLALGIGANSAIFSIVNAVLLRRLPFNDPERIVFVWETFQKQGFSMIPVSVPNFYDWKEQNRVFEDMATGFSVPEYGFNLTAGGEPERVNAAKFSSNYMGLMGIKPALGRTFLPEEDRPGGAPVAMIGYGIWQRRFGADRNIIGRTLGLDGAPYTVVGVMPPEFKSLGNFDVCIPVALDRAQSRTNHLVGVIARLKPESSLEQAQAEMTRIARSLEQQYPESNKGYGATVMPINQILSGPIAPVLVVLQVAVGLLLLITCANVASVLFARSLTRNKEIAIRIALGANRLRIVRQLLTESLLLSFAGGALGLFLAGWSVGMLRDMLPDLIPRLKEMGIDGRVLLFTLAVSVITGILFGLAPAFKASRGGLTEALKEGGGKNSSGGGSQRARSLLLVGEIALTLVLTISAGLLVRSFARLMKVNPGFQAENVLTMNLNLPVIKYKDEQKRLAFFKTLIERVETLPGVKSAGAINVLPLRSFLLSIRTFVEHFQVEGRPAAIRGEEPTADWRVVTTSFFQAMGVALHEGRFFNEQDGQGKKPVAVINETMARRYLAGEKAVGRRLIIPTSPIPYEIVGVVGDLKLYSLGAPVEPGIYVPYAQSPFPVMSLVVRTTLDPTASTSMVRREVLAIDGDQPIADVKTMRTVLSESVLPQRLSMAMLGAFAVIALVLALVGIYGLTAFAVSHRTREIGIRMALGAQQSDVLRLVIKRGMIVAAVGIAIGIFAALAVTRGIGGLLFGIASTDPIVYAGISLLLVAAAVVASYFPARKATEVDPIVALRHE